MRRKIKQAPSESRAAREARGRIQRSIILSPEADAALRMLASISCVSRSEVVDALIMLAYRDHGFAPSEGT